MRGGHSEVGKVDLGPYLCEKDDTDIFIRLSHRVFFVLTATGNRYRRDFRVYLCSNNLSLLEEVVNDAVSMEGTS